MTNTFKVGPASYSRIIIVHRNCHFHRLCHYHYCYCYYNIFISGDTRHEWTASKSMNSMFKFFRDQYDQRTIEQPKFLSYTDIEEEDEDEGQIDESHEKKFRKLEKPKLKDN